jgi:hypothetical protein
MPHPLVKRLQPELNVDIAADHTAFTSGLHDFEKFIKAAGGSTIPGNTIKDVDRTPYDAAKLKSLLEDLAGPLFHHVSLIISSFQVFS